MTQSIAHSHSLTPSLSHAVFLFLPSLACSFTRPLFLSLSLSRLRILSNLLKKSFYPPPLIHYLHLILISERYLKLFLSSNPNLCAQYYFYSLPFYLSVHFFFIPLFTKSFKYLIQFNCLFTFYTRSQDILITIFEPITKIILFFCLKYNRF